MSDTEKTPITAKVFPAVSILPNDYSQLENKPSINGIVLQGNLTSSDLELVSTSHEEYEETTVNQAISDGSYVLTLSSDGVKKVTVEELILQSTVSGLEAGMGFITTDELNEDVMTGAYQFVEIKD